MENVTGIESIDGGTTIDLLYEDPERGTVLSDLKTSSAIRFDHKLQSAAYKRAIESSSWGPDTIHECEVIRLHPDKETVELSRSPDWDRTLEGLAYQFLGLVDHCQMVVYSETLTQAHELLMMDDTPDTSSGQLTIDSLS